MEYRKLGNSELEISAIAFGAWAIGGWMWGGADEKEAVLGIEKAYDLGMTTIDTAPVYGFGKSEEIVGKSIKGKRDKIQLFTKYGLRWDTSEGKFYFSSDNNEGKPLNIHKYAGKQSVIQECENSLKRLKTDYIDLYQIHWPDPTTRIEETMEAVIRLLEQGKIRYAGVSNYGIDELKEALKFTGIVSDQVPFSMVNREIEKELIPYCKKQDIGILAYSPLQRGLLTGKYKPGHQFNEGDHRPGTPFFKHDNMVKTLNFLEKIKPIAEKKECTLAQLVINWTINVPGISCALTGARNPAQVEQNALICDLTNEEIREINTELNNLNLDL